MRQIDVSEIHDAVSGLCLKANFELRPDVLAAIKRAFKKEEAELPKKILGSIVENARLAKKKRIAICQDTGMVTVFLEIGQDVAFVGGDLNAAVNEGVREAYRNGYLRKSVVSDPLVRKNTMDNTPAVIHVDMVQGDRVRIVVSPKGFGSENKSAIRMFNPTAGPDEIREFVLDVVRQAGPDACPPFVLGIGIGGTFEEAALLSKKAVVRRLDMRNPKRQLAKLEKELVAAINSLNIGPMGLGGETTVLGVKIMDAPTHIAGLPVAVTVSCHVTRSAEKVI